MTNILLTIILFVASPGSADEADAYVQLRQASFNEYQMGHFPQAEFLIQKALESARSLNDQYNTVLAYSALGDIYQGELRFAEADRSYREALFILNQQQSNPKWSHAAAIIWGNRASGFAANAQYREAYGALKQSSSLVKKYKVDDPGLNAEIINTTGILRFQEGDLGRAEASFLRAAKVPFDSDYQFLGMWDIWNNLGRVYQAKREYDRAEDAFKRSMQFAISRFGESHPNVATILGNLGSLYSDMGRYKEAEDRLQQSLAVLERTQNSNRDLRIMHTLYELGKTCIRQHNEARAEPLLSRSVAIARKGVAAAEMPEVAELLETYSKVLKDLSNSTEAAHLEAEARRVRASLAFTVHVGN